MATERRTVVDLGYFYTTNKYLESLYNCPQLVIASPHFSLGDVIYLESSQEFYIVARISYALYGNQIRCATRNKNLLSKRKTETAVILDVEEKRRFFELFLISLYLQKPKTPNLSSLFAIWNSYFESLATQEDMLTTMKRYTLDSPLADTLSTLENRFPNLVRDDSPSTKKNLFFFFTATLVGWASFLKFLNSAPPEERVITVEGKTVDLRDVAVDLLFQGGFISNPNFLEAVSQFSSMQSGEFPIEILAALRRYLNTVIAHAA